MNDVDSMIESLISPDPENAIQFLITIPGVKRDSAITIISEIGIDICLSSATRNAYAVGLVSHQAATNLLVRRNLSGLHLTVSTSNLH